MISDQREGRLGQGEPSLTAKLNDREGWTADLE